MMTFIVGMRIASALEAESMTFEQITYWYPLARAMSDKNAGGTK